MTYSPKRGFALLIAVIIMSLMLSFGLAIGSLSYKQQVLVSGAIASQYAFYAADGALECGLYVDQQLGSFAYPIADTLPIPDILCDGTAPVTKSKEWQTTQWILRYRFPLDSNKRCADLVVYQGPVGATTTLFAQGYDTTCATISTCEAQGLACKARIISRGLYFYL